MGFNIGNLAAPVAQLVAGKNIASAAAEDKQRAQAIQDFAAKRQADNDRLSQALGAANIAHLQAQTSALGNETWEKAEPFMTDEGPIMAERNKKTSAYRRALLDVDGPPPANTSTAHEAPGPLNSSAASGATEPLDGPPTEDQQSVVPPQAITPPQQTARAAGPPVVGKSLAPYVKPSTAPPPLADKMQKDIAAMVASGVPLSTASARVRLQYGQQDQQPPQQSFSFPTITGPDGKQVVARANTKTGEIEPTDVTAKAGGAGGGANQAVQKARMLAAVSEARLADERMRAYEDKLLSGASSISPLKQAGGSLTTNLADSHTPFGALLQAGSEFGLNRGDPEYAQYLRDASTIGRAEQMISPRGGNETMVRANALLSRAGSGAQKETIDASRMARQALFGEAGGLAQSMTPEQNANVKAGLEKIKTGTTGKAGASGDIDLRKPVTPSGKPDLATRVQQLKAAGISKAAAFVQLQHEGYDLTTKPPGGEE